MATVIKAPHKYDPLLKYTIFLAGSIDMGQARNWQQEVEDALADLDVIILNPRRDGWDSSWTQSADDPQFREQVTWEYDALGDSDLIVFVVTKDSKSPITMYEFGRFANKRNSMVCVEEGFYRQGNLDLYSEFDNIPIYHNLDEMIQDLRMILQDRLER